MAFEKIEFKNTSGHALSGRLELPLDQDPVNYAVFAHCFTCSKNFAATRNISRALTDAGFAVLRFDFTGLGDSDGDFEDTNFSGNVEDLVAAIDYLAAHHKAPTLLIGHSLGGAAAIYASAKAKSIKAIATIGTPSDTSHVKHLFESEVETITQSGEATVQLSGRAFKIKKQFLDDINEQQVTKTLADLRKPILIAHSPQDTTVSIQHAEKLYLAARHPKSFVSLDGTDHLLFEKEDAYYIGQVIAQWSSRYIDQPKEVALSSNHNVVASLDKEDLFTTRIKAGKHHLKADEPLDYNGKNYGPSPYELLSAALGACTAMTIQMYARRKEWDLGNVSCHVTYDKSHAVDCENCMDNDVKIDTFTREITIEKSVDDKMSNRILQIADKCPVHKTLHSETQVITKLL